MQDQHEQHQQDKQQDQQQDQQQYQQLDQLQNKENINDKLVTFNNNTHSIKVPFGVIKQIPCLLAEVKPNFDLNKPIKMILDIKDIVTMLIENPHYK